MQHLSGKKYTKLFLRFMSTWWFIFYSLQHTNALLVKAETRIPVGGFTTLCTHRLILHPRRVLQGKRVRTRLSHHNSVMQYILLLGTNTFHNVHSFDEHAIIFPFSVLRCKGQDSLPHFLNQGRSENRIGWADSQPCAPTAGSCTQAEFSTKNNSIT